MAKTRKRVLSLVLSLVMVLSLLPIQAWARPGGSSSSITVTVLEKGTNVPIPGATVKLEGKDWLIWNEVETKTTDQNGVVTFSPNGYDKYRVTVSAPGREADQRQVEKGEEYTIYLNKADSGSQSGEQWRNWWPVFWGFDHNNEVEDSSKVAVTAGAAPLLFTDGAVGGQDALDSSTANAGNAIAGGIQITTAPGYYLSRHRLVCGNYTDCGVVPYGSGTSTPNTDGDYTATTNLSITGQDFNHWTSLYGGLPNNYPSDKPTTADNDNLYLDWYNTIYPFYLLLEVKEDTNRYSISYDWGSLGTDLSGYNCPVTVENLLRNETSQVASPSEEALLAAMQRGYVFTGWKVTGTGYGDNAVVTAGNLVAIYGSNLQLSAQ